MEGEWWAMALLVFQCLPACFSASASLSVSGRPPFSPTCLLALACQLVLSGLRVPPSFCLLPWGEGRYIHPGNQWRAQRRFLPPACQLLPACPNCGLDISVPSRAMI
ncbi:hypothetical protein B0T17DRAFT_238675 [Bombardia bombarda]|uniref:Secreted protein n=1 Tax=Bombardia bombarda TaxID=252184 RepID=A0AA39XD70_9PEZI|nr:hypothetical protein B0T17DRAFT_238675 [Bombardia bombarda]